MIVEGLIVFIFGLFLGSFLFVLIKRLPLSESVVTSRSKCDFCGHTLSFLDLVPVLSFVSLGGRCRYCRKKLSAAYPLFELFCGVAFLLTYFLTLNGFISYPLVQGSYIYLFLFMAVILATLIVIFFADLFSYIIPLSMVVVGLIATTIYLFLSGGLPLVLSFLPVGIITALFFLLIYLVTLKRGIGFGDVIYGFYMGFFLGFPKIVVGLYGAFLTGAFVSIILILLSKKRLRGGVVPFGPFLVIGTVFALLFGDRVWSMVYVYLGI